MHMQEQDYFAVKQEEEFSRPVESIMRCEDFKSNFARRLSNRYITRSPSSTPKQESSLKLLPTDSRTAKAISDHVPERVELGSQLFKAGDMEQNGEAVKPPDKTTATNTTMQHTEVTALHMKVDTLKWQLAQTEANRQMHIALLNQIVTFLNKVKDHIECKKPESGYIKSIGQGRTLLRSFNSADLPRSRSVVHVNKQLENSLNAAKRIGTRKISQSISNVNGFNDCSGTWNQSKISLISESDNTQKITEEMSRLITLANTVLSTKLPDLACMCSDFSNVLKSSVSVEKKDTQGLTDSAMNFIEKDITTNDLVIKTICDSSDLYEDLPSSLVDGGDVGLEEIDMPPSTYSCNLENDFAGMKLGDEEQKSPISEKKTNSKTSKLFNNRRLDYNHKHNNFIEDESGFSSMSSFQEIGIPIISIIPPSPCKEVGYIDDIPEIMEETGNWKNEIELNKQTVKVFWV